MSSKGIFCLEGLWHDNLEAKSSVEPILTMLEVNGGVNYIHQDVATVEELEFYLRRWRLARYRSYPILYLAFHGENHALLIGNTEYSLDRLATILDGACENAILLIASCNSLRTDKRNIKRFLQKTGALAVCGYRSKVSWMVAAAFEILILSSLQEVDFSNRGIWAIERRFRSFSHYFSELDFTFVTRRELRSPDIITGNTSGTLLTAASRSRQRKRPRRSSR